MEAPFKTNHLPFLKEYFAAVPEEKRTSGAIAFYAGLDTIGAKDPETAHLILKELRDQRSYLKLIASENYSSLAVQCAMGNLLTDKYAEGYPHKRFYAGCENVDQIEGRAATELRSLFGADHAYIQPHSGADANLVAMWSILVQRVENRRVEELGKKTVDELTDREYEEVRQLLVSQKMMGLGLGSGGHLTHGYRRNISSKFLQAVAYDVDPITHLINYKGLAEQVKKEKPLILVVGYSSYSRLIDFAKMREIADSVGAVLLVDMAHFAGLVAGKVMQGNFDPIPHAHLVTSTTHKTLRGPRGGFILCTEEFKGIVDKGCPLALGGPLPHVLAAKGVAFREAREPSFQVYARQIVSNAKTLSETLLAKGVPVITGGTDNHLLVFDVRKGFGLTGRQAEGALRKAGLTVNRNAVPQDPNGAWYTSGIRVGTPALTTLGMKEGEMRQIGLMIWDLLSHTKGGADKGAFTLNEGAEARIQIQVKELLASFPLYSELLIA